MLLVSYDEKNGTIREFYPKSAPDSIKHKIIELWSKPIYRQVLLALSSSDRIAMPDLLAKVGHSASTLHAVVTKLAEAGIVLQHIEYVGKRRMIITPQVAFISGKGGSVKMQKFFQGLWSDSDAMREVVNYLQSRNGSYADIVEISRATKIPPDKVELLLSNWDSFFTKPVSSILDECPFEKRVLYRAKSKPAAGQARMDQ